MENKGKEAVYKIKSNLGDKVEVNHVYGIVGGDRHERGKILLKYVGVRESIEDVRVRICWVEADSVPSNPNPTHE